MPLRGSRSHWRVLGAALLGSKCSSGSGGVRRDAFSDSLNPRDTRTSGQPPPVGGSPFGADNLLLVSVLRALCQGVDTRCIKLLSRRVEPESAGGAECKFAKRIYGRGVDKREGGKFEFRRKIYLIVFYFTTFQTSYL